MNISSEYNNNHRIILGDARDLSFLTDESIDLICTHPPYANAISYSNAIENDLSQYDHVDFLRQFKIVTKELHRVLKKRKFCCIMMGDLRKSGNVIPLGFMIMQTCIESGLKLKEIIIKEQFNTTESAYWEKISIQRNFLLLAHEYIFVFYK